MHLIMRDVRFLAQIHNRLIMTEVEVIELLEWLT